MENRFAILKKYMGWKWRDVSSHIKKKCFGKEETPPLPPTTSRICLSREFLFQMDVQAHNTGEQGP